MIGLTMTVTRKGHVRAAADDRSGPAASVQPCDTCTVVGYTGGTWNGNINRAHRGRKKR